jgi:putative aminophosphonate oxidoreductase
MTHPRSLWLEEALAEETAHAPLLEGEQTADVCIVGGGYTGLWTALHLKEADPSLDVLLIEKDVCGGGASGRNGGFILSWWAKYLSLRKICGEAEALRLARASADAVTAIGAFCDLNGIDSHYRHDGWLWAATSGPQVGAWNETRDTVSKTDPDVFENWNPEQVATRSGSPMHLAGIFEPNAASVQPARLARGLRRVALERGVRIYEGTPLERLVTSSPATLVTPRGSVRAKRVVLAMNAWAIRFSEIRKAMIVVTSDIVATAPVPERLRKMGWDDGMTISDGRALVQYYRNTLDGRLVFGKGGMTGRLPFGGRVGAKVEGAARHPDTVARWLRRTYPELADVPIASTWTGPIDREKNGLPIVSCLGGREDIVYAVGFSGNGVGPTFVVARMLASLALERRDEWSECPLVRKPRRHFPPEPIRYIGGQLVGAAIAAKDRAEDKGHAPGLVTRLLSSFAPAGLSPWKSRS